MLIFQNAILKNSVLLSSYNLHSVFRRPRYFFLAWNFSSDHAYSAASSYEACFRSCNPKPNIAAVWDVKIKGNIQFFWWLMVQNRLWNADRLEHKGWPHQDNYSFCD
jgi:hypothetical protein